MSFVARFILSLCLLGAFIAGPVFAQAPEPPTQPTAETATTPTGFQPIPALPVLTVKNNPDGSEDYTVTLQILLLMTALSFLPAMLMMMTSFTRIIIVQKSHNRLTQNFLYNC